MTRRLRKRERQQILQEMINLARFLTAVADVSISHPNPNSERIQAILLLSLGQYNIGLCEIEYEDISELLEAFDIDDGEEIWEVPE